MYFLTDRIRVFNRSANILRLFEGMAFSLIANHSSFLRGFRLALFPKESPYISSAIFFVIRIYKSNLFLCPRLFFF